MESDERKLRILFLGASSVGKTTIIKQIQKIHHTLNDTDIQQMAPYIKETVIHYIKILCWKSRELHNQNSNYNNDDIINELKEWHKPYKEQLQLDIFLLYGFIRESQQLLPTNSIFYTIPEQIYIICINYYLFPKIQFIDTTEAHEQNQSLMDEILSLSSQYSINPELAEKIAKIWTDPGIKNTLLLRSHYQIPENVEYFLDRIQDITNDNYSPSFEDYIRIRCRTTGWSIQQMCTDIEPFGQYTLEITDTGGERSERKKWRTLLFYDIDAIIYPVGIADYDKRIFEDDTTNRLHEAINLFQEIVNGKFCGNRSIIILFNKYDLFKEKIKIIPITVAFEDYPTKNCDPNDEIEVVKFIEGKFLECFHKHNNHSFHIYRTNALDTDNITNVFGAITSELVKSRLEKDTVQFT